MPTALDDLVPHSALRIHTSARTGSADPFDIITPAPQWSYAAWVDSSFTDESPSGGHLRVTAQVDVSEGRIGVGWTRRGSDEFVVEKYVSPGQDSVVVRVPVDAIPGRLMFRNVSASGPSRFVVRHIQARIESELPPYPISVEHRDVRSEEALTEDGQEVFEDDLARHINVARLAFLASLELPLSGKRVLDAGCGVGHHTAFYTNRGCRVVGVDGRAQNVETMRRLYPNVTGIVGDLQDIDVSALGAFDIVHCFGLLYHLDSPVSALRRLASVCGELLIIETMVCDAKLPVMVLADEPVTTNQALAGLGCRPSPSFMAMALDRIGFGYVYGAIHPPDHPDFQFEWHDNLDIVRNGHNLRCVFVASRAALHSPRLRPLVTPL